MEACLRAVLDQAATLPLLATEGLLDALCLRSQVVSLLQQWHAHDKTLAEPEVRCCCCCQCGLYLTAGQACLPAELSTQLVLWLVGSMCQV